MSSLPTRLGRAFKQVVLQNLGLKIVALVMALSLFSLVHGTEDAQRFLFVDVEALLPPPTSNRVLVSELPEQIKLTIRGSRSLLNSIRREEIAPVQMDLRAADQRYYYFEGESFEMPAGVNVVQMSPSSIPLTWAKRVQRRIPVEVRVIGAPGRGLMLQRPLSVEPSTVLARGPDTEVQLLRAIDTEPIDVRGLRPGRHERWVSLAPAPPHTEYPEIKVVRVSLEIAVETRQKLLRRVEVSMIGAPNKARMRPSRVDILLRGPVVVMEKVADDRIVPYVDLSKQPQSAKSLTLPVSLRGVPSEVEVVQIDPAEVIIDLPKRGRR